MGVRKRLRLFVVGCLVVVGAPLIVARAALPAAAQTGVPGCSFGAVNGTLSGATVLGSGIDAGAAITGNCVVTSVELQFSNIPFTGGLYDTVGLVRMSPSQVISVTRNYQSGGPGLGVTYPIGCSPAPLPTSGPSAPAGQAQSVRVRVDFAAQQVTFTALGATWTWSDASLPTAKVISANAGTKLDFLVAGCVLGRSCRAPDRVFS